MRHYVKLRRQMEARQRRTREAAARKMLMRQVLVIRAKSAGPGQYLATLDALCVSHAAVQEGSEGSGSGSEGSDSDSGGSGSDSD